MEKCFIQFFEDNKGLIGFITTVLLFIIGLVINNRARRIQTLMVFKEFREPVIKFANEVIDVMSEIEGLCECNPKILGQDFFNRYNQLLIKISSLRDKGRLFIPNNFPEKYGTEKATAYQGLRHEALDYLAAAYHIAASINFSFEGYNKKPVKLEPTKFRLLKQPELLDPNSDEFKLLTQARKIKVALDKLPILKNHNELRYVLDGPKDKEGKSHGWSSKKAIVETKRRFVSAIQELIRTRYWGEKLKELSKQDKEETST